MKILVVGDIVGGPGRMAMARIATRYKAEGRADVVVANAENSAAGRGITGALAEELFAGGADALTMGDHVWDQKEAAAYFDRMPPKSLDRDDFAQLGTAVAGLSDADAAATLVEAVALSVARGLDWCPVAPGRLLVTGGGRHNPAIMARLTAIAVPFSVCTTSGRPPPSGRARTFSRRAWKSVVFEHEVSSR